MVAVYEADRLGLRAALEHRGTTELQIFDEDDAIAIGEDIAVGVLYYARTGGGFGRGFARPFMTASDAFPFVGKFQNFGHLAHRAGRFAHKVKS